jgi:protein-L-isoaspartate(D-aspartate) O-methyltransferase
MFDASLFTEFAENREKLIEELRKTGIHDERVLDCLISIPRHEFVPEFLRDQSYDNNPLDIGFNQTISQPWMVADMAQVAEIKKNDKILEIGSGCGYNAAVISRLGRIVYSTEIIPQLCDLAAKNIAKIGLTNIVLLRGDGSIGCLEHAPYDVIMVTAAAPYINKHLVSQLSVGGRLIIPVYDSSVGFDRLMKVVRISETEFQQTYLNDVRFVPLTGQEGFVVN